jgi:hypothetical protein
MNKLFIICLLGLFFTGCKSNLAKGPTVNQVNSSLKTNLDSIVILNGAWAENSNELTTVFKDSKVRGSNEEKVEWYSLNIHHDTIIVEYNDNSIGKNVILKLTNDTLILKYEDGSISTLIRRN